MATGQVKDPHGSFRFSVEIDGIVRAAFKECTGFESTVEVKDYREGGENATVRKLPGLTKYSNITLKWGMADDTDLYDWHRDVVSGEFERKNGSIVLFDRRGVEVARWNFVRAWPTRWDGPDLNAETSDIAIELIELVHEGIERA
jgi:phage tail-like protein